MTITIKLKTDNAAFEDNREGELASILREAVQRLTHNESRYWSVCPLNLTDSNGNTVCSVKVTGK